MIVPASVTASVILIDKLVLSMRLLRQTDKYARGQSPFVSFVLARNGALYRRFDCGHRLNHRMCSSWSSSRIVHDCPWSSLAIKAWPRSSSVLVKDMTKAISHSFL